MQNIKLLNEMKKEFNSKLIAYKEDFQGMKEMLHDSIKEKDIENTVLCKSILNYIQKYRTNCIKKEKEKVLEILNEISNTIKSKIDHQRITNYNNDYICYNEYLLELNSIELL